MARHGPARRGATVQGRSGEAWLGKTRTGKVWNSWQGADWLGEARRAMDWLARADNGRQKGIHPGALFLWEVECIHQFSAG